VKVNGLAVVVALAAGFVGGRWTGPGAGAAAGNDGGLGARQHGQPDGPLDGRPDGNPDVVPDGRLKRAGAPTAAHGRAGRAAGDGDAPGAATAGSSTDGGGSGAPSSVERAGRTLQACEDELVAQREVIAANERRRKEAEGEPIAARADTAPRFQPAAMVQTFERAFASTKIVGRVESVDCTEHPCILFGRLQGDEEGVATLEDAEPFSAYDDDVGVMLTWASADHAHEGDRKPGVQRQKPPEISLFAFAYYSHEDRERHGELIDRRIRVRTAEYWNSSAIRE
jgi:hypothetical protein